MLVGQRNTLLRREQQRPVPDHRDPTGTLPRHDHLHLHGVDALLTPAPKQPAQHADRIGRHVSVWHAHRQD